MSSFRLKYLGLPLIRSLDDLSQLMHLSKMTIWQLSANSNFNYKCYQIPKKRGGLRTICSPSRKLKAMQAWILINILSKLNSSSACKGFEKGTSICDNVKPHISANALLTVDIKDFYPSITSKMVFNVFRAIGYNDLISTTLTRICTYRDVLPQGSPCSPKLANLIAWKIDVRLTNYVGKIGVIYTRYADDLSFSGQNPNSVYKTFRMVKEIIKDEGFTINEKKTRIAGPGRQKEVTGLVLSDNAFGIGKRKYKKLRGKIFKLARDNQADDTVRFLYIKGYLAYLKSVDLNSFHKAQKFISELQNKYQNELLNRLIDS